MGKSKKSKKSKRDKSEKDETTTVKTKESKKKKDKKDKKDKKSKRDKDEGDDKSKIDAEIIESPKSKKKEKDSKKNLEVPKDDKKDKKDKKGKKDNLKEPDSPKKPKKNNKSIVILDPKDMQIDPNDLQNVKEHLRLMGESPRKKPVHCNKGRKLCVQCYFKHIEDEDVTTKIIETSKRIRDDINNKIIQKLDHGDTQVGDEADLELVIVKENQKIVKHLEKQFEHDPDYIEMHDYLKDKPEMKADFLKNLAHKRFVPSPIPTRGHTSDIKSSATHYTSNMSHDFSDVKSTMTKGSYYSASVRNSRYRQDMDGETRKEYFKNLKVIKRLQKEKKKREQVLKYFENKEILKHRQQEEIENEEKKRQSEERRQQMEEFRQKMEQKSIERQMLRQKQIREGEKKIRELKTIEPLHEKYEKKYLTEVELPELEKRQKILHDISENNKSDLKNIGQHSMEYQLIRKAKIEERMKKRLDQLKSCSNYSVNQYKTKTYEQMAMRDDMQKSLEEEKRKEKLNYIKNTKHYAKNVLELHKPSISKTKQMEMKRIIDELNKSPTDKVAKIKYERSDQSMYGGAHRSINGRISRVKHDGDPKYMSNLSSMKGDESIGSPDQEHRQDLRMMNSQNSAEELDTVPEKVAKYESALNPSKDYLSNSRSKTMIRGKYRNPLKRRVLNNSIDVQNHNFLKIDYLAEKRNKRMENGGYDYIEQDFWRQDMENPEKSSIDKFHDIKRKADILERKAKLKEELITKDSTANVIKDTNELSGMYMDAIRAKAALLSNL